MFNFKAGTLHAEAVPLTEIAAQYGTPTYVYSKSSIVEAYQNFDQAFSQHDHLICYSVKANSNIGVLSLLAQLGSGFDIVSGGELQRVLAAGGDTEKVVFSGVGKQAWEMELALAANIACFNLESASELLKLNDVATGMSKTAPVSVRVNPNVDAKTHPYISTGLKENKFGVSATEALRIYEQADKLPNIRVVGIDFHIGSQITELSPFSEALTLVLELVDKLEAMDIVLDHIDLGGGVGINYHEEGSVEVRDYASAVLKALGNRPHKLLFEPGRIIVGEAGVLLTKVTTLKENEGKHFAIVDCAMNDLIRPALYQSWQRIDNVIQQTQTGNALNYDIVGPICESSDFLGHDRKLVLEQGDLLAIHSCGAYGFTMSSNYNSRGRAAEVMVSGSSSFPIRKRESIDEQLALESLMPADI